MATEKTEVEVAYNLGMSRTLDMVDIDGVKHAILPPGCSVKDFEHLMPAPTRIKAHPMLTDIASFKEYIDSFKDDHSRIFIDEENKRFFTIFDCHGKDKPAWGDHSASYQVKFSREWERFKGKDGVKMDNMEFAEFIEDNVAYITAPVTGVDLLAMSQSIKAKFKGDIEVDETLHAGIKKLLIQDDTVARGMNAAKKEVTFPEQITMTIRVYHNDVAYSVNAHLRYRKSDKGLIFWIKIPDAKAAEEEAFDNIIARVKAETGLPTLKGSYQGISHKK
jgi:uncharacterized protein YfdQ (DUF2303 family)